MADTIIVDLVDSTWTQISATSGFATNESVRKVIYREATAAPADNVHSGHTLENSPGAFFQFTLTGSQKIFARSIGGSAQVAVTPEG